MKRILLLIIGIIVAGVAMAQVNSNFKSIRIINSDSTHSTIPGTIYRGSDLILRWVDENGIVHRFFNASGGSFWKTSGTSTLTGTANIIGVQDLFLGTSSNKLGGFFMNQTEGGITNTIYADNDGLLISASGTGSNIQLIHSGKLFRFSTAGTELDLGSDATGDTYYRNSGTLYTRLPIGTSGQVYTVSGGIPSWQTPSGLISGLTAGRVALSGSATTVTDDANLTFGGGTLTVGVSNPITLSTVGVINRNGSGTFGLSSTGGGNIAVSAASANLSLTTTTTGNITITPASNLVLTLGSDATGDTYYRNGSGNFIRLPIGSANQAMLVSGGVPTWGSTGLISGLTTARVPFASSATALTDASGFSYDATTGILTVQGSGTLPGVTIPNMSLNGNGIAFVSASPFNISASSDLTLSAPGDLITLSAAAHTVTATGSGDITLNSNSGSGGYIIMTGLPTSCAGVPTGGLANVAGVLNVCP